MINVVGCQQPEENKGCNVRELMATIKAQKLCVYLLALSRASRDIHTAHLIHTLILVCGGHSNVHQSDLAREIDGAVSVAVWSNCEVGMERG